MLKVDPSKKPWFVAYLTLGYPTWEDFMKALKYLKDKADLIEIGIPPKFAKYDGPTIRKSYEVARANGISVENFDLSEVCEVIEPERLIAMTYFEDVSVDLKGFLKKLCAGGVLFADAVIDYVDKVKEITSEARKFGKDTVYFVSPTTPDHVIREVAELSEPILYLGVRPATGIPLPVGIPNLINRIKSITSKPIVVGFGLKKEEVREAIESGASGIVVGSALVKALSRGLEEFEEVVKEYLTLLGR
ncbi:tryptophan synthase subunit alpha [Ignicoccus islandicus DSM 13165]|uniref:tryptophan synthase n=1 Tax=Ignicoccus islandicus DSM 13165 TaxID=940295 RepID=A0A0U2WM41_9CREN|nr:tryptophan synthase subunit alpha [Ignicoccus islandicus]ALU12017.1 tryptophan synthase subunit alpha [Ignicoccus islandicus DSM 13165]